MEQLNELRDKLQTVADALYQERVDVGFRNLCLIIPELEITITEIQDLELQNTAVDKLKMALEAMESEDTLLLADIIQYELLEIFS